LGIERNVGLNINGTISHSVTSSLAYNVIYIHARRRKRNRSLFLSKPVDQFLQNVRNTARQMCLLCAVTFQVFPTLQEGRQVIHIIDIKRT